MDVHNYVYAHVMASNFGHVTTREKLDRENLFWWWHLDTNSDRSLSNMRLSTKEIINFSVMHRSHHFDTSQYAGAHSEDVPVDAKGLAHTFELPSSEEPQRT